MPDHKNHCLILYFAQHTAGEHIHIRLRIRLRIRMSPLLHRNDKNLTYKLEVDPSILVGRGLAPAGEDPDKNLPCIKGVSSAKRDGGIVLSAGASPRPTIDPFALS